MLEDGRVDGIDVAIVAGNDVVEGVKFTSGITGGSESMIVIFLVDTVLRIPRDGEDLCFSYSRILESLTSGSNSFREDSDLTRFCNGDPSRDAESFFTTTLSLSDIDQMLSRLAAGEAVVGVGV